MRLKGNRFEIGAGCGRSLIGQTVRRGCLRKVLRNVVEGAFKSQDREEFCTEGHCGNSLGARAERMEVMFA